MVGEKTGEQRGKEGKGDEEGEKGVREIEGGICRGKEGSEGDRGRDMWASFTFVLETLTCTCIYGSLHLNCMSQTIASFFLKSNLEVCH